MNVVVEGSSITGPLSVPIEDVTAALADSVSAALAELDTKLVAHVADTLGMSFTGGDVTLHTVGCEPATPDESTTFPSSPSIEGIPEIVA
jgi:hypothetical protein